MMVKIITVLNPIENEYEELINKRNLYKNIKKYSEVSKEIKNLISNFNSNDDLNLIEKNLNNQLNAATKEFLIDSTKNIIKENKS